MKRYLLILLLLLPIIFAQEPTCYRPALVSCAGAQEVINCMWQNGGIYVGHNRDFIVNLIYDFWIELDPGEVCNLDLKNGIYQSTAKAFAITGGPNAQIALRHGTIIPLYESGYYGIYVGSGVKKVTLEDIEISGFKSGIVGGHALSLVGDHELYTNNVYIYDSGIGIATSGNLYWTSENTWVWGTQIGVWTDNTFGGTGSHSTWICQNVIDVDIGGILDLAAKSFKADVIVPSGYYTDYSSLFDSCEGFVPPTETPPSNNTTCPNLPKAVAKADIIGGHDCVTTNTSEFTLQYNAYAYEEGRYALLHFGNGTLTTLSSSYLSGYITGTEEVVLHRGLNTFYLSVIATSTNECGTDTQTDEDFICINYAPANCTSNTTTLSFNGEDVMEKDEYTVYMHSPAYLNISAEFEGDYEQCYIMVDGLPVTNISYPENTLTSELVFTEEGDHVIYITCEVNHCNPLSKVVHVRKANKSCSNKVDILNMPDGACLVVRNISSYTAEIYANSENTTSTLKVYLNGDLLHTSDVSGPTSLSLPFVTDLGQYNVYAEITDGTCFDSDFGCIIVEPPEEECTIYLDGYLPNGETYTNLTYTPERFAFWAFSNYNLQCEFKVNGSVFHIAGGKNISFDNTYLMSLGTYDSEVYCYAPSKPSCSSKISGHLVLKNATSGPNNTTCDLTVIADLPVGNSNYPEHNVSWNTTSSEPATCVALLNYTEFSNDLNFFQTFNLATGQYYWQLYCYQLANPDCNARFSSHLNVSLGSPPPQACYLYLYADLPSGTYENNTTQSLWYTAISNTPMECNVSINDSLVYTENNTTQSSYNLTQLYGLGSYLFHVGCYSLTDPTCGENRISSMYVVNGTLPAGGCNITVKGQLPSGTYNNTWSGMVNLSVESYFPAQCNYTLNNTLRATFNESYSENLTLGLGEYIFSVVCEDTQGCIDSMASSLYVVEPNTTVPSNITCVADVSFRDLPDTKCEVVYDGEGYLVYYNGYVSQDATLYLYHNEDLLKKKTLTEGHFSGNGFVDLVNGTNTFMVRVDAGACGAIDSACVYLASATPNVTLCDIGVTSYGELAGQEFTYTVTVYDEGQCMVFKDGEILDRFNTTGLFTTSYVSNLSAGNHTFKITCLQDTCVNSSEVNVSVSPSCEARAFVSPSTCQEASSISYQLYSNYPYNYSVVVGDVIVEQGEHTGLLEQTLDANFSPGIYTINASLVGQCSASAHGCLIVSGGNCSEGANITLKGSQYKVEADRGRCWVWADGYPTIHFDYEGAVTGNIEGNWTILTIACEDELYCPFSATYRKPALKVDILENATGLKLTPEENSTLVHYVLVGENATCQAYLDGKFVYEEYVSPGIHAINLSFAQPGIYGLSIACNSTQDKTSAYKQLLVYYSTTNDTNPPHILLVYPPNNSVWEYFPKQFLFIPLDDRDPMLDCRLNVFDKYGKLVYTLKGTFSMGKQAIAHTLMHHRIMSQDFYYWNVTCVDNGDPVGYSDTWVFGGTDEEINTTTTNFIYPNQTIYTEPTVKIYYGVNSTLPTVNSTILLNNLPLIPWTDLESNKLYATVVDLPAGEYNVSIVSYVNDSFIVNKTSFKVILPNDTLIFYNNLSTDNTTYTNDTPVKLYFNVTHSRQEKVNSTLYLNNQPLLNENLTVGVPYTTTLYLQNGTYTASLLSVDNEGNEYVSNVSFVVEQTPVPVEIIFYNYIHSSNNTYITSNTSDVTLFYGVVHTNQSAVNSSLYLNQTLLLNANLSVNTTYNLSLTLSPGEYNLTIVSVDNRGEVVYAHEKVWVIGIKKEKEEEEIEADEKVLAVLYPPEKQQGEPQTLSTTQVAVGIIIATAAVLGLIFFLWRKRTVVIELLEEPHVGVPATFIVKEKGGKPVKQAMLIVLDPEGKEITLITDQNGVASFIPKMAGQYTVKPVKYKPAPESVVDFMVK